jgi:hypothetical protein
MDMKTAFQREDKAYNEGHRDGVQEGRTQREADVWVAFGGGFVLGLVLVQFVRLMFG